MPLVERLTQLRQALSAPSALEDQPPRRRGLWVGSIVSFALGCAALAWLNGPSLFSSSRYHTDLTQSPHWMGYHNDNFPADDLLVHYGAYNESPVQNVVYWLGTLVLDVVLLQKLVGIVVFGLTAALFYGLVATTTGARTAALAAGFFIVFPRSTYEIAGGFSKAWAIGFVLLAVWIVETRGWRVAIWTMPLAALAYPVAAVMMGAVLSMGVLLELSWSFAQAWRAFKILVVASLAGVAPLLAKYLSPSARIGDMITPHEMRQMWKYGESFSATTPLAQDLLIYLSPRYILIGAIFLILALSSRGLVWRRSWTALALTSVAFYYIADWVVPAIYLPDRYSRFSAAILLVLWFAHNWSHLLAVIRQRWLRWMCMAGAVGVAGLTLTETFRPCRGDMAHGLWENKDRYVNLSRAIADLPDPVLVAGHPRYTAEIVVQARKPVLVIDRMYHAWYRAYRAEIGERIRATFAALYADDAGTVNRLAEHYGVTHLVIGKGHYRGTSFRTGRMYRPEFDAFILSTIQDADGFVLYPPPEDIVVYEDSQFWLVRLPLDKGLRARP